MSKIAYFNYRAALLFIENECFIQNYYRENTNNYISGKKYRITNLLIISLIVFWEWKNVSKIAPETTVLTTRLLCP